MAVNFGTDEIARETTQWTVLPEHILLDPELNGRHEHTEVAALAADIYAHGQNTPCLIRKNADGLPVLVYGHRRYRAVAYLNEHLLKPGEEKRALLCNYQKLSDEQAFRAAVTENHQRADVNDMDHSHNINVWRNRFKKSLPAIAEIYFPEAQSAKEKADALRWVENRADLAELAPEAAQAVRSGEVKITAAVELAKLSENQQRQVLAASGSKVAGQSRIKVKDVKAAQAKNGAKNGKPGKPVPVQVQVSPMKTLALAEGMARAIDGWLDDPTAEEHEKAIEAAHRAYRALVPFRSAEAKAA